MAAIALASDAKTTRNGTITTWTEKSADNTALTMTIAATGHLRRIMSVFGHYEANVTKNVTVDYNSTVDDVFDVRLNTTATSSSKDTVWIPAQPVYLPADVALVVTADASGSAGDAVGLTVILQDC